MPLRTSSSPPSPSSSSPLPNGQPIPTMNLSLIIESFDERLREYPIVVQSAGYVGIRPVVFVGIIGSLIFFSLAFGWGGGLVCNLVGFLYPAWLSFKAIEQPKNKNETLLLMYWVVYAAFSVIEYFVDVILFWLPFYYLLKLCFLLYLYLPWFKGAEVIYVSLVRPYLLMHQNKIDDAVESISAVGVAAADGVSNAVSDGIDLVTNVASNAVMMRSGSGSSSGERQRSNRGDRDRATAATAAMMMSD